uniref:Retroviral polymerase SH3-like domain-containing protein n=1 Tax=Tanacetum cinerariifolium TaxID=118510 RepID=A0A699IPJ1_TANCI|nr:hypothetical protein [Tanacetum cinerariifolium]
MYLLVKEDARLLAKELSKPVNFSLKTCTLKTPRQNNMYSIDLNNIVPHRDLTCLVVKASADECMLWHRRLVADDFSRFTWTFFLKSKDETSGILKKFITEIENLKDLKVKIIRVLVNKSHNKTPYELFNGRSPAIGFLKPFGCHVMILNTLDNLGMFEEKGDEGYFIGYLMSSKAFRVFNKRTRRVEENLHVEFLENKAIEKGAGPNWLFDINSLTKSMNYVLVDTGTISTDLTEYSSSKPQDHCSTEVPEGSGNPNPIASTSNPLADQMETLAVETPIPTISSLVPTAYFFDSQEPSSDTRLISKRVANQEETPSLDNILSLTNRCEDILRVTTNSDESNGVEADISNMETAITASPTPTLRIHKDHPKSQIIGPLDTPIQTRNKSKVVEEQSFIVYQMDVKSTFLYGTIDEEVGTIDHTLFIRRQREDFILVQVYVDDIIFGSSNPQLCREFEALMHEKFQMSAMGDILKKFGYSEVRSSNAPMDKENPWGKDKTGKDVDLHLYRSMIGSLMYLTASRPDIMFAVCSCARHQVTPKESYSDSDYGGATQDQKSTTRWCQFLGRRRLISWQCKKQTIVATSTTEAKYVAAASCCGQVLWIQNQLLDYRDCFEKKLISVDHIHTDENVADLLTKPFDAGRF